MQFPHFYQAPNQHMCTHSMAQCEMTGTRKGEDPKKLSLQLQHHYRNRRYAREKGWLLVHADLLTVFSDYCSESLSQSRARVRAIAQQVGNLSCTHLAKTDLGSIPSIP